mgnify:CR=1 FL=1
MADALYNIGGKSFDTLADLQKAWDDAAYLSAYPDVAPYVTMGPHGVGSVIYPGKTPRMYWNFANASTGIVEIDLNMLTPNWKRIPAIIPAAIPLGMCLISLSKVPLIPIRKIIPAAVR